MRAGKLVTGLAAAVFAATALAAAAPAVQAAESIKIGAMRLGTSWYVFGATLAKLLEEGLPEGSTVDVIARGGGVGNPIAVSTGKAEVALSNVATAVWAWNGHEEVYKGKQYRNIRALVGALNPVWITVMVRKDYIERTGNDTLEAIFGSGKPVRVVMKPPGSSVPPTVDMIFKALGTGRDKIKADGGEIIQVAAKQIPSVVRDGRADVYFETAIKGHPAVTEASLTGDVAFLDMPDKVLDHLAANGLEARPLPQWFKGQSGPTKAANFGTVIIAHEDLPEDLAYLITKTIVENKEAMAQAHKAWANFEPAEAWKREKTGIALHPGAERYYKEAGLMK